MAIIAVTSAGLPEVVARIKIAPVEYVDGGAVVVVRLQTLLEHIMKGTV
jgi:hypothetical protein